MEWKAFFKTVVALCLVAGTCVGGGILALPVEAAGVGVAPALVVLLFSWLFMLMTGFLYVEATFWLKEEKGHIVTMGHRLLGRWGKIGVILVYLFMGYASLVAYSSGGSPLVIHFCKKLFSYEMTRGGAAFLFTLFFGSVLCFGAKWVGWLNSFFVLGMIFAYFFMVFSGMASIQTSYLQRADWSNVLSIVPLMITSFSYQMIIPSLAFYLKYDKKALKRSIFYGTMIPAVAYTFWLIVVLGIVPSRGPNSLHQAFLEGVSATESLRFFTSSKLFSFVTESFAFFAIVSSYFGIGLGLFDFLSDWIGTKGGKGKKQGPRLALFFPTLIFSVMFPKAFLYALDITGGLGDAILNGAFPVLMIWFGKSQYSSERQLLCHKGVLTLLFLFSLLILFAQIYKIWPYPFCQY